MAADVPVMHMAYANRELAEAELNGETVPCREDPGRWTSDLLAFKTVQSRLVATTTALECIDSCPVFDLCKTFADQQHADRNSPFLYGIVAGRLVLGRKHYSLGLSARPSRPKELTTV
jgi:hypothetical protein